ncbi:aldose 1-epimerase family protein [Flavobacterium sp.]|uniref:aldose 1-epimerase family protein n=1 Tax=Flavobacterium sp. TaxID=239 RepID=UPI002487848F|nr:aldose 1-epimerase family protein [Flavobacterium sp.]MDI1316984.1 aldose 1-epimerase family protein [Flavobacterium sp.]
MTTTLSNSKVSAAVNHQGAELISLKKTDSDREYIWEGHPEYWAKHSPILFPIVGTLKNDSYTYKHQSYQLSRHGFARDMNFELVSQNESSALFSLKSHETTKGTFPFDFELQLIYTLNDSELSLTYRVINNDSETIYYSIGGHPAFALPNSFEIYSLQFESNENLICYELENDLLSDKTKYIELNNYQLPLTYSLFEKDALIFKQLQSNQIQLLENNVPFLNFKFDDFPNFGIWTKINAPFICLEPWAGYSDVLNTTGKLCEKEGIQTLQRNASKEYTFSIEIL